MNHASTCPLGSILHWMVITLIIASVPMRSHAAAPTGPTSKNLTAAERFRQAQWDAQVSLSRKLRVGQERYQQKQAYRRGIIEGMETELANRRSEVTIPQVAAASAAQNTSSNPTLLILELAALGGVLLWLWYYVNQPSTGFGTPSLGTRTLRDLQRPGT
jgi:hypothetical protein